MNTAVTTLQLLMRLTFAVLIVLGILFWTGTARQLVPIHTMLGALFVVLLWVIAGMAARAHVGAGLVAFAIVWGLIVLALGMTQTRLLVGGAHWVIQVLHLLVAMAAIGIAERLARASKEPRVATA
jgi:hypothetical protein